MDTWLESEERRLARTRRRRPGLHVCLHATVDDGRLRGGPTDQPPQAIEVEVTDCDGELAEWCNDFWWTELLQFCADSPLTVTILPTPGALLHPVLLHELCMLRRVAPHWRLVGCARAEDIDSEEAVQALVTSPYHEVRFSADTCEPGDIEEAFGRIRRAQIAHNLDRPVLVRLSSSNSIRIRRLEKKPA